MLRSKFGLFTPALLLTVLATSLAGCGGATGELTFDDEDYPFSFSYPGSWTLSRNVGGSADGAQAAQKSVSVALKEPYDQVTIAEFKLKKQIPAGETAFKPEVERIVKQMASQAKGKVGKAKEVEYGGAHGFQYVLTYPAGSATLQNKLTLLFKGGVEYQVGCQSQQENREELLSGCDQILDSLKLD